MPTPLQGGEVAGSTPESRQLVNKAVQRALGIGETLKAGRLREFQDMLGLCDELTEQQFVGTLRSIKHNSGYRREAGFDLSDLSGSQGSGVHDFVLTRHT